MNPLKEEKSLQQEVDESLKSAANIIYGIKSQIDMSNPVNRENVAWTAFLTFSTVLEAALASVEPELCNSNLSVVFFQMMQEFGLVDSSFDDFTAKYAEQPLKDAFPACTDDLQRILEELRQRSWPERN